MAEETVQSNLPALPPKGEMIPSNSMYIQQLSLYRNTLAFGGTRNPTEIWAAMTYNMPQVMAYFRELEDKDEDVSNCLDTLKLSVTERAQVVLPADDQDTQAVEIKEFIEAQLARFNFDDVMDCMLDAPGYGFSVQEMIFDVSAGQAELLRIEDCPQELFLFGNRFYPQVGDMQLLDNPWAAEGQPVPEQKFIIFSYRRRARNRMGRPLLKAVFWPSWFKRNTQRLWMQFAEKGPGTAVVRYNDADSESEKKKAAEIAQAIVENTAIAVPKTFEYDAELLKIARAQDPKVYQNFFEKMQYAITRRTLGETLTSFGNEGGTGSQAQGKTHADTFDTRSVSLSKALMAVVNDQVVKPLVIWNFGPDAPMPKWTLEIKDGGDLVKRLAVDAGLQRMGKKFTVGYIAERYDVPLATGENEENPDDVLIPNINAPQVAIADQARATFAEGSPEQQAHRELKEFDDLFDQLRTDSGNLLRERTDEILQTAVPVEVK